MPDAPYDVLARLDIKVGRLEALSRVRSCTTYGSGPSRGSSQVNLD